MDSEDTIFAFREKNDLDGSMINAGYMVLQPEVFDYIDGDNTVFEKQPLETIAQNKELKAFCFDGFWKCMDTQRDKVQLEKMWESGQAPWKVWR